MQLLCLTDNEQPESLPGLDLLSHELRGSPLSVPVPASAAARFDLILVDGTKDIRRARAACYALSRACDTPRLLLCAEAALAAVTPEWQLADVLLPNATPAEIEVRLRLAAARRDTNSEHGEQGPHGKDANGSHHQSAGESAVSAAGVVIDESNFTARVQGRMLDLTYKEFELLYFLTAHPGRVFTREQLLSEVWGTDYYGGTRTVDVHVRRLRAKLGEQEGLIGTVRGVGYGFARNIDEDGDD